MISDQEAIARAEQDYHQAAEIGSSHFLRKAEISATLAVARTQHTANLLEVDKLAREPMDLSNVPPEHIQKMVDGLTRRWAEIAERLDLERPVALRG